MARTERTFTRVTATIANGGSLSGAVDASAAASIAIQLPAAWTAAALSFQASPTLAGTYGDVFDDAGAEVTVASASVVANRVLVAGAILSKLVGLGFIKIRSGISGAPVAQGAARDIVVLLKT